MEEVECKMCGDLGNWSERDGYPTCDECWRLMDAIDAEDVAQHHGTQGEKQ